MKDNINNYLNEGVLNNKYSGAVWLVYKNKKIQARGATGYSSVIPSKETISDHTIFDLASLTKPLITAPLTIKLADKGIFDIEKPIVEHGLLPFAASIGEANIFQILTHTSGVKAWYPCYIAGTEMLKGTAIIGGDGNIIFEKVPKIIDKYVMKILSLKPESPPGENVSYSCLGYILLSYFIQIKAKVKFRDEAKKTILDPLAMKRTFFSVPNSLIKDCASGEEGNMYEKLKVAEMGLNFNKWRTDIIKGQVNDCNAFYANSESGNSGLFADIDDTLKLAKEFLKPGKLFSEIELRLFHEDFTGYTGRHRSMGWRINRDDDDPAKDILSSRAISHSGFTGTSIWIDPEREEIYILFLNRLHPFRVEFNIDEIRRKFLQLSRQI